MDNLRYTLAHEWLRAGEDGEITVGITDYAQEQLGDIVYVELPELDAHFDSGANLVVIESVKAVGEIEMPFSGRITAINERLVEAPEIINAEPLGAGWLVRIAPVDAGSFAQYMDDEEYRAFVATL
jgi:glycine cleavage system H protein